MIPLFKPYVDGEELSEIKEVLESRWLVQGAKLKLFESSIAALLDVKHVVACSSCTAALHLALSALGVRKGQDVLVADYTFPATGHAVCFTQAHPIFVDIQPDTYNISLTDAKKKLTALTSIIIPVHTFGQAADMDGIIEFARENNLYVIEDAACAFGSKYKDHYAGTIGDVGCFSFHATKGITCFPGETRVVMKHEKYKGKKGVSNTTQIENVNVGDVVLSFNEKTSEKEYKTVTKKFERKYKDDLIYIKMSNGNEFTATPNHPIFVKGKWIQAGALKVGDLLLQYKYRELQFRLNGKKQKGKTYEEIWGQKRANIRKELISHTIKENLKNPDYGYWKRDTRMMGEVNSKIHKGRKASLETKERQSKAQQQRWDNMTEEERETFRNIMSEVMTDDKVIEKISKSMKIRGHNPEFRKKISIGVRKAMQKQSYWENYSKGLNLKPNKSEDKLYKVIQEVCPNEFQYNGDFSLGITIDRLIPDFVNVNGKKKVIELFGNYWHEEKEEQERKWRMKKLGWDCLIIWETELYNIDKLKTKIETFLYNPNIGLEKIIEIKRVKYDGVVYNIEVEDNHNYFVYGILVHNCGEGGCVVTNDDKIATKVRSLLTFGSQIHASWERAQSNKFIIPSFDSIGFNYKMSDIAAACGIAQLRKLDRIIKRKRQLADYWTQKLESVSYISAPYVHDHNYHNYQGYCTLVDKRVDRDTLIQYLKDQGIGTQIGTYASHMQPAYDGHFECPVSLDVYQRALRLPLYYELTEDQIDHIITVLQDI